jgi:hypothetical protein
METMIIVRDYPHWASDETLPKVRARFKRLTGTFPSKLAEIVAFTGSVESIAKITIDEIGTINYPKDVTRAQLQ